MRHWYRDVGVPCLAGGSPSTAVVSKGSTDREARRGRCGASGSLNTHPEAACAPPALPVWGGDKNTDAGHAEEWDQPWSMWHLFIWSVFILNVCFWNSLLNMIFSKFNSHNIYSGFCANIFWLWAFGFLFHINNLQICITAKTQPLHLFPLKTLVLFDRY